MTKRVGGFLMPDSMELPEDEVTSTDPLKEEEPIEETSTPEEETHEEGEETSEEVTEEEVTEEEEEEEKPVAILNVYGKQITVKTMDELIAYAQQGVDYAQKLYQLKQWKAVIEAVSYTPKLKILVDKVIAGEDVSEYILTSPKEKSAIENEDELTETTEDSEATGLREALEEITDKKVQKAMAPFLDKLREKELTDYLGSLAIKNPKYHETITKLIVMALQDNTVPLAIKEAIKTDRNFFENMYNQIWVRLEQLDKDNLEKAAKDIPTGDSTKDEGATETDTTKQIKMEKVRSVAKVPTLEGGRDSQAISTAEKVLDDAEKIWSMKPEEFKLFEHKVKSR